MDYESKWATLTFASGERQRHTNVYYRGKTRYLFSARVQLTFPEQRIDGRQHDQSQRCARDQPAHHWCRNPFENVSTRLLTPQYRNER